MTDTQNEALTTTQIIERIHSGASVHSLWFDVLEEFRYSSDEAENDAIMVGAAQFLELKYPGQRWTPSAFKALLDRVTGRYDSAADIAVIRAKEALADGEMTEERFAALEKGGDEAFVSYLTDQPSTHTFSIGGVPGGVVVFDGLRSIHDLRG